MSDENRTPATESSLGLTSDARPEALVDSSSSTQAAGAGPSWLWAKVLPISEETGLKVGQDQGRASTPELLPAGLRSPASLSPHWLSQKLDGRMPQAGTRCRQEAGLVIQGREAGDLN